MSKRISSFSALKRGGRGDKKEKKTKLGKMGGGLEEGKALLVYAVFFSPFPSRLFVPCSLHSLFLLSSNPPFLPTDVESNFAESRYTGSGLARSHETSHASPPQKRGATWSSAVSAETGATTATLPNRSLSSSGHRRNPPLAPGRNNRMHSSTEARCGNGGKRRNSEGMRRGRAKERKEELGREGSHFAVLRGAQLN